MIGRPKILIVEDHTDIAQVYKHWLTPTKAAIDTAKSKREAIEKARCATYDVALVDIMLLEDTADRGGIEVVKYIHDLKEGTQLVVVTGTHDIQVALDTYKTGIFDFVRKSQISEQKDILGPVQGALKAGKLTKYGSYATLNAYMAAPEMTPFWEEDMFRALAVGYSQMNEALEKVFKPLLPVLRVLNSGMSFLAHPAEKAISGTFWSKGVGQAVWVCLAKPAGTVIEPPAGEKGDKLVEETKGKVHQHVWQLVGAKRDAFYETMWDRL